MRASSGDESDGYHDQGFDDQEQAIEYSQSAVQEDAIADIGSEEQYSTGQEQAGNVDDPDPLAEIGNLLILIDFDPDMVEIRTMFEFVDLVCDPNVDNAWKGHALYHLSITVLLPERLPADARLEFIKFVIHKGVIDTSVALIETGSMD